MTAPSDYVREALSRAFPIQREEASLEIVSSSVDGDCLKALVRLTAGPSGGSREQELALGPADGSRVEALAAQARARLEKVNPASAMPGELLREATPYQKVPSSHQADPARWVDAVLNRIRDQAQAHGLDARTQTVGDWEPVPRTIYFLHFAHSTLAGRGLEVFLGQAGVDEVAGVLEALETAGVKRLAQRLREGLGLIARDGGQLNKGLAAEQWLAREKATPPPGGWSEVDSQEPGGTAALVANELRPAMTAYLHNHHTELVR